MSSARVCKDLARVRNCLKVADVTAVTVFDPRELDMKFEGLLNKMTIVRGYVINIKILIGEVE